ncbi:MAG TPA: FecR domain-containing protein [Burkholderiales bacterium]|nr:FecR domain-containing protein [Burkholderiales bacterium]
MREIISFPFKRKAGMGLVFALLLLASLAQAQVGHVVNVTGSALVERDGRPARILGAGEPLEQKDVINVAHKSHAVLEFLDRTRITLRPSTIFRVESYSAKSPQGMVFGLSKGGFRAATGEIGKANPTAVRFQTDSVVLGIRGTEFDARLCAADCSAEERARPVLKAQGEPAARVIQLKGSVNAIKPETPERTLVAGAMVFPGESVRAGADSYALVVFRDGSRATLTASSELAISEFEFDQKRPEKGHARLRLVSGKAHVWTGTIAKTRPDAFVFETTAGVIRTSGAGFTAGASRTPGIRAGEDTLHFADARVTRTDVVAAAGSAGDDVFVVHTWDGTIVIQTATETIEIPASSTLSIAVVDGKVAFLPAPPPDILGGTPRPDSVSVDPATFGAAGPVEEGLYVWVRDGAVTLASAGQTIELKAGNAARVGERIAMLETVPNFMRFDLTPPPGTIDFQNIPRFFRASDGSVRRMCR